MNFDHLVALWPDFLPTHQLWCRCLYPRPCYMLRQRNSNSGHSIPVAVLIYRPTLGMYNTVHRISQESTICGWVITTEPFSIWPPSAILYLRGNGFWLLGSPEIHFSTQYHIWRSYLYPRLSYTLVAVLISRSSSLLGADSTDFSKIWSPQISYCDLAISNVIAVRG